ncbi:MAG: hypothetical protein ACXVE8_04520 [Solirubrobacteraceae bacterium]
MEVVVSRCSGSFRGSDKGGEPPDLAKRARQGGLLDPRDPCPLRFATVQLGDVVRQRHHDILSSQFDRQAGSTKETTATVRRVAEFSGASHGR